MSGFTSLIELSTLYFGFLNLNKFSGGEAEKVPVLVEFVDF